MFRAASVLFAVLCLLAGPLHAQDLTEEEILHRFELQREMYRATLGGQKTRGLEMIGLGADSAVTAGTAAPPIGEAAGESAGFGAFVPELQVNLAIRFGFDSAAILPDQRPMLERMCAVMRKSDVALFRIIGHTDGRGGDGYNERLSRLRAEEVRRWLVEDCGIAASRLEPLGMGKRFLANPADPAAPENRRVEFQAVS